MDNQTFLEVAQSFKNVSNFCFKITVGKNNKALSFVISINPAEFTHIVGLDHIPTVQTLVRNKNSLKRAALESILSGKLKYSDFTTEDRNILESPINKTFNPQSQQCYTINNRIERLKNIGSILSEAYKGDFYKWKKPNTPIKTPDGKYRQVDINADYLLTIPTGNSNEKMYFFMYCDRYNKDKTSIHLKIFSAFQDGVELYIGQERPYKILTEDKINLKTKQTENLYVHPNYTSTRDTQNNINIVKFSALSDGIGNTAVLTAPRFSFGQALANLLNKWADKIQEGIENRRRELQSAKEEIAELKQAISERDEQLAQKDEQLNAKDDEIAVLHKQNTALTVEMCEQRKLIQAANPPKTLSQKFDEARKKCRERNAQNPHRRNPPNQNRHKR